MEPDTQKIFAANVRRVREERDLSQMQLAERSNLNMTDISRIEKLRREPGLRVVVKVARGLSVPIEDLFEGIETVGTGGNGG
jgi:transcriptional regulator with XRE-family HTH domain